MSSSVFVESSRPASDSLLKGDASVTNADSNLVVVYGKNGINVDREGLESLIDEKTLTSISVIRITSPTPSMQEEEAEEVRKLAEKNAEDDEKSDSSQDDDDEDEDSDSEDEPRTQKPSKTAVKDRPEIVGLTVEEFYPPEAAKELAKEILKYAGVTPLKCNVDYEFQRYVIKNDHCYTPYTSPSQLIKEKKSGDDDDKQQMSQARKFIGKVPTVKQYLNKRKILKDEKQRKLKDKDKISTSISDSDGIADSERQDDEAEEEAADEAEEDESEYSEESEESADSDNDRDSDLDFDVNNRHGRKRKTTGRRRKKEKQRARSVMMQKPAHKRRQQSQDNGHEEEKVNHTPLKVIRPPAELRKSISAFGSFKNIPRKQVPEVVETPTITATLPPPPPPPAQPKPLINIQSIQVIQPASPVTPQPRPLVTESPVAPAKFEQPKVPQTPSVPKSPQIVKELDISKVVSSSPKGGFTDLSTLLSRSDNMQPNLKVTEIKPEKTVASPSTKGFMPLVIESAVKNQLPAQISIQTHQSSSEIAAENDKQSELIDSIVIPLEKSFNSTENTAIKENSIPDLVKMLESTEKAVLEKTKLSSSFAQSVEAIDIANAPLLETPDDEIPDDLLQHVVELMEDKNLQEAVEKEVLQQQQQQENLQSKQMHVLPMTTNQMGLHQPPRQTQVMTTPTPARQPRSIIEASISNTPTPTSSRDTTPTPTTFKAHNVAYLRKEPIQIVRGNGRVITLPPIEAPTTRAKRRAQAQPSADTSSFNDSESGDISMHSDTSIFSELNIPDKPEVPAMATPKERTPATKAAVGRKRKAGRAPKQQMVEMKTGEEEESQEDEDEDDPNKLWCICRQPHNNRFMICCDMCEDWFHGTCVSITKAMGLEMEQKGIEWTCPKCVKKQESKKQRKITDLFDKKTLVQPMPKLDDFPKPQLSISTALEIQAPKKPPPEIKKSEPPSMFNFTKVETPKKLLPRQEHSPAVMTAETPDVVQRKITEFPLKKTPELVSATPTTTKRIIVVQSTPKTTGRTLSTTKGALSTPPMQQQILKLTKVSTPGEKKQFMVTKMHPSLKADAEQLPPHQHSVHVPAPQKAAPHPKPDSLTCIVCNKTARANSIYCSDDCIRKHAQNALNNAMKNSVKSPDPPTALTPAKPGPEEKKKKSKGLFEDLLSMADRKPKVERVYVFERRTGKLLTGNNAPTTLNLKKWLQDNPTFEVVQPGSPQALEIEKSKQKIRLGLQSPTSTHMFTPVKGDTATTPTTSLPPTSPLALSSPPPLTPKPAKIPDPHKPVNHKPLLSPGSHPQQRSATPKHFQKHTPQAGVKQEKPEKEKDRSLTPSTPSTAASSSSSHKDKVKKQVSVEKETPPAQPAARSDSSEPVRLNVRRTLKEQLMVRMNELSEEKRLSSDQVDDFVKATEFEMYRLFNKDIGAKYKAKYRSLMFNIKDRKNETLFQKICGKLIEPRQLVRMSPEEMASQELAQWRENEAKHQLEMIKKSELDMLSCTKNYVLKTHKGEEVIESKSTDRVELDISIPVEDVVTVLNNSTVSSTTEIEASSANPKKDHMLELDNSMHTGLDALSAAASSSSDKKHGSSREREREREKRHKSKDRHREKSRKRSRSRSRERRHKSSSRKDERRDKEEHGIMRKDHEASAKIEKPLVTPKPLSSPSATKPSLSPKPQKEREPAKKPSKTAIEKFNLIDQILESTKTVEQAANIVHDRDTSLTATTASTMTTAPKSKPQSPSAPDSDQEPSSTVSISTPPEDPYFKYSSDVAASMWTGPINMIDVASFSVSIQTVSGNAYMLSKDLPEELDVVGRISPDTVWDYIGKIKRSPNKEIVIIRLVPSLESENIAYTILYKYLDKRKRLGVIKTMSPNIKDFYIMPLGVGQQMPTVLHPTENFEFYEDVMRPDMLLGIVIRIMGKRHSNSGLRLQRKKEATVISNRVVPSTLDGEGTISFTPPGSPKPRGDTSRSSVGIGKGIRLPQKPADEDDIDVDAIIKAPITAKNTFKGHVQAPAKKDDADEPYSPGGSSDDDVQIVPMQVRDDDLKRKMEDINRRIEAQKMEIAGLLSHEQASFAPGSTALAPSLANISIPSNLQQILASIQSKPDPPALLSPSSKGPSMVPPPPLIGSLASRLSADDEEYVPEPPPPMLHSSTMRAGLNSRSDSKPSRLAQLSEAELLSMVPDDIDLDSSSSSSHKKDTLEQPLEKRPRWSEPPPPGLEGEYN